MAVDEALLVSAGKEQRATLRFYGWQEATLSLGYFQSHADREAHTASQGCPVVRRGTGGGAIVHDRELTYSFVAPIGDRLSSDVEQLYYAFHETLIDALRTFGVEATLCVSPAKVARDVEPFLCFQRRAAGDVLLAGDKICGSAQRRHYGAVLQHGSVLLQRSPAAQELSGVTELAEVKVAEGDLLAIWQPLLAARLGLTLEVGMLSASELEQSYEFLAQRFASPAWTLRR